MIRYRRTLDGVVFLLATASTCALAGCGASDDGGGTQGLNTGGYPSGGAPAGTTGGAPVASGGVQSGSGGVAVNTGGLPPASGGAAPGSGGALPSGGTPATGAVTGSGGAPPASGGAPPGTGATPGTGGTPSAVDPTTGKLIPPEAGKGLQISTATFTVNPGQEIFRCYHTTLPANTEIDVSRFESVMSKGSHHFILYRADTDTTPSGTLTNSGCTLGFDQRWVYTSGSPYNYLDMPKDVAMVLDANQKVVFDMHYINTTSEPITAQVVLNIDYAQGNFQKAAALVSFNRSIAIPPNGQQTVQGDCTPGPGAKFFLMSTHTHRRGVLATITRKNSSGQLVGDPIVKTTDWEHPSVGEWMQEPFETFATGEKFQYSCQFQNDRNATTFVGSSADTNEMCMAVTYYFPDTAGGSCN